MTVKMDPGSHPTRVRGLKLDLRLLEEQDGVVAPHAGAWIETQRAAPRSFASAMSHPTRVRGLKRKMDACRHLGGGVAPHAGAWIETPGRRDIVANSGTSHPTRVRGLKPALF